MKKGRALRGERGPSFHSDDQALEGELCAHDVGPATRIGDARFPRAASTGVAVIGDREGRITVEQVPDAGGEPQAMAWYRAQPIAAFGDRTAEALVKEGKAAVVRDYLDFLSQGNFA